MDLRDVKQRGCLGKEFVVPSTVPFVGDQVPESDVHRTQRVELTEALVELRRELGSLSGTLRSPFSGIAVDVTALEEIKELIRIISVKREGLPAVVENPSWDAVGWIVETSLDALSGDVSDASTVPVLKAAQRTNEAMWQVESAGD